MHGNIFEYSLVGGGFDASEALATANILENLTKIFQKSPMGGGLPGGGDMGSFGIDWYRNDLKSFVMKSKII